MHKRLFFNSASGAVLYAANIVIAFIMSPIIVRALGNRDYGIWEMLLSFCGYFGILELGLGPAIIRSVSREIALGNWDALKRVFNSTFWGLILVGLLSLLAMCLVALKPETILNLKHGEVESLPMLCVLAGFNLFAQFTGTLFVAVLMGRQEHFLINGFRFFIYSLQAVLIYLALTQWGGAKLIWVSGITLAGNIFQYAVLCVIVFLREENLSIRFGGCTYSTMKELYRFGIKSVLIMVSDRIQRQSLPIIIGNTIGASFVVFYVLPKRLVDYARNFVESLGFSLMPYFSSIDALRRPGERMKEWIPVSRAVSFIALPVCVIVMVLGEPFLNIWIGAEYGKEGQWVIMTLCVSFLVTGMFSNSSRVLIAADRHGPPAKLALIISLIAVSAAIPVTFCFGINGAAVVIMMADIAACWVFWQATSRYIGIGLREHFRATIKPLIVPIIFHVGALIVIRLFIPISGYCVLAVSTIGTLSLYLIAAWYFTLNFIERQFIQSQLNRFAYRAFQRWTYP